MANGKGKGKGVKSGSDYAATDSLLDHMNVMMTTALNNLRTELINDFESKLQVFQTNIIASFEKRINDLENKVESAENSLSEYKKKTDDSNAVIAQLRKEVNSVHIMANHNEQYSRRWLVRAYGIAEEERENCTEKFVRMVNDQLKVTPPLVSSDIEAAHRLFKQGRDGKPRPMIVRFMRRDVKFRVLKNRKDLKPTAYSINEDITKLNLLLLNRLRNNDKIESAWFSNGTVKAKHASSGNIKVVELFEKIENEF